MPTKLFNKPEFHIAVFAFLLNYIWELMQMPLFLMADDYSYYEILIHCMIATFGDVLISLAAFKGACRVAGSKLWIISLNRSGVKTFVAIGLVITVLFEFLATGPLNLWQYGALMPVVPVIGVGLSPVLQWLILPLLQLWFVRRQLIGGGVKE